MPAPRKASIPLVLLAVLALPSAAALDLKPADAAGYLEFESIGDGRCQNLSDGGKLRILHNRNTDQAIKYRLQRTFVGRPQGLSVGIAGAGEQAIKLGCTRVDGRPQDWVVERAQFTTEDP